MKFILLCKRHYTNKDLIADRFGRLFHLPFQLNIMGHEGLVIAGDLRTLKKEKNYIDNIQFYSIPLSFVSLYQFIHECNRILTNFKPDLIIASGDSYLGYMGLKYAQKLNIPFVFDVYDDYTVFGTNKIPGMKTLFYKAVESSNLVVTSGEPLRKKLDSFNKNIVVIENGFDPDLFRPMSQQKCRQRLNIPAHETIIGYFGSIAEHLGIEVLLSAAEILQEQTSNLRFLIAGHNGMNLAFEAHALDYRGFLPQKEIPELINACDVVVIPYLPSKQVEQSNACKISEYIACQVPIVATRVSNHSEILAEAPQSLCDAGDPSSLATAIKTQLASPQVLQYPAKFTWRQLAEKLNHSLEELVRTA